MVAEQIRREQETSCKHDMGFFLPNKDVVYHCALRCGFTLNFDPALFPIGVAYVEKDNGTR